MQVRVFESQDMTSGLQQIRREMGPDALILSTKTIRGKGLGRNGKPMLEITAAIDDLPANPSPASFTQTARKKDVAAATKALRMPKNVKKRNSRFSQVIDDDINDLLRPQSSTDSTGTPLFSTIQQETRRKTPVKKMDEPHHQQQTTNELYDEVRELRSLINDLSGQLQQALSRKPPEKVPQELASILQQKEKETLPQQNPLLHHLLDRGIQPKTARTLANFLEENYNEENLLDARDIREKIVETIESLIEVAPPQFDTCGKQQRIAFVGPTGVGKTTTLAKVCAHYLATKSKSVALITIDTYRIAAVEQLKIYGEIMGLPVDVVFTPEQMEEALLRHQDKELILIDTAGRSPRDSCNLDELSSFFKPEMNIDKHLVLSAATRERELTSTVKKFRRLGIARTIFTKLDECFTLGVLLNVQLQNPAPLSWLTNGQRVPEDLLHISAKTVAELIMMDEKASA